MTNASTPSTPAVRVVVVTYNSRAVLGPFLDSLAHAGLDDLEVVVVDNASAEPPTATELPATTRLVVSEENLGYGGAANLGLVGATSPWLVVANPDVIWEPGSLAELLRRAEDWPQAGAVGPAIVDTDGSIYPSAREFPSLTAGIGHAVLARIWPGNPWTRRYHSGTESHERLTDWLSGSCLVIRREAFESVGGFDEDYFMFFEDVDLCDRLGKKGWTSVYLPSARIRHDQGHSWRKRPEMMLRAHHDSAYRYLARKYSGWYFAPLRLALRLGLGLRLRLQLRGSA